MTRASLAGLALLAALPARAEETVLRGSYTEGPFWVGEKLYYAEMYRDRVITWTEAGGAAVFWERPGCGPTSIAPYRAGFLVLCHLDPSIVAVDAEGKTLQAFGEDAEGAKLQNPNDSAAGPGGGVYFSDPGRFRKGAPKTGRVMHLSATGALRAVAEGLDYPNGIAFDAGARQILVSEHLARRVLSYPVMADGSLGEPETLIDLDTAGLSPPNYAEAGPDGVEIAPDGTIWVPDYGEGRILAIGQDGLRVVEVKTPFVTNVAVSPGGMVAITGAYDNARPPFPSIVSILPQASLARRLQPVP
ncbi:MAG: SMP-30/gluconolactonase/LRE family protein [Pseudomonadota bacterium]